MRETSVQTVAESAGSVWADGGLRVQAATAFSGLSRSEIYERIASGELPTTKLGRARIIAKRALVRMLEGGAK